MYFMYRLESTGEPGRVHISAKTYAFLVEDYFVQPGEKFKGKYSPSFPTTPGYSTSLLYTWIFS